MPPLVLASASPRRAELLRRVGIEVEVQPADTDETVREGESATACAVRLAAAKADGVFAELTDRWVLAADTVVEQGGVVLGKPADAAQARSMLISLSGQPHRVTTAFSLRGPDCARDGQVTTEVRFRDLSDPEIQGYVFAGEWRGKAGGYAVQGMAAVFVAEVRGSVSNVIGFASCRGGHCADRSRRRRGRFQLRCFRVSESVADRLAAVSARIAAACARADRDPASVTLVAVSKRHPAEAVMAAHRAGARDFGENYAQELVAKAATCADLADVRWHFIGKLQRNKAKLVVGRAALIHAVDTSRLAAEIDARAGVAGVRQAVLIAVNVAGESTKSGVSGADAGALVAAAAALPRLDVQGLMTMPPPVRDPEENRPHFRALAGLARQLATPEVPLGVLSMGMSSDLEVAVEEGATIVRVGTAVFGPRPG